MGRRSPLKRDVSAAPPNTAAAPDAVPFAVKFVVSSTGLALAAWSTARVSGKTLAGMNLLSRLFNRKPKPDPNLIGLWRQVAPEVAEPVLMKFCHRGRLEYHIVEHERVGIIKLTYRIEDAEIISNQPSSPREERTRFELIDPDGLLLRYGGQETRFSRVVLREYDIVRIARLLKADRFHDGTEGAMRPPAVGDVATICHENDPSDPSASVVVEMCDADGNTIWLADFEREELELGDRQ